MEEEEENVSMRRGGKWSKRLEEEPKKLAEGKDNNENKKMLYKTIEDGVHSPSSPLR